MKKAYLLLADGTLFEGTAVGYEGQSIGEVVFNTGMAGYQEVLTDPSYYGQVVTMTYPLVGNYGINFDDYESRKSWVSGFIMREMCEYPSNWRCKVTLDEYLKAQKVVGLAGIDTRRLTRKLRGEGVMNGVIYTEGFEPDEQTIAEMKAYVVKDAVKTVTCDENIVYPAEGETKYRIALFDYGVKYNIERELCKRGCEVTVVPAYTKPEEVIGKYDGVMLSNGPGDPAENVEIVANLKELLKSDMPIFGICLGMQIAVMSYARNVLGYADANSGEFDPNTSHPVIDLMESQHGISKKGGTMRLGAYPCKVRPGSIMASAYGSELISERHRHRYEFNNAFREEIESKGMLITGTSPTGELVETVEIPEHPFYIGVQFHPEFKSRPNRAHPLFKAFVAASLKRSKK